MTERAKVIGSTPSHDMLEAAYPLLTSRPSDTPDRARRLAHEVWAAMWEAAESKFSLGLTRHQRSVHNFLAEYIGTHGRSPMWDEIIAGATVPNKDGLKYVLKALERVGVIARPNPSSPRNIVLLIWPGEHVASRRSDAGKLHLVTSKKS